MAVNPVKHNYLFENHFKTCFGLKGHHQTEREWKHTYSLKTMYMFFYSSSTRLLWPLMTFQAETFCQNNTRVNICCVWLDWLWF